MRRHGTPLDALGIAATVGLAWLAGRTLGREHPASGGAFAGSLASLALGLALAGGASVAHRGLYRARELALLLAQPLDASGLVRVRIVELSAIGLIAGAVAAALVAGTTSGSGGTTSLAGASLATLLVAPLLAGGQLVLAWAYARAGRAGRVVVGALLASVAGGVALELVRPDAAHELRTRIATALATPLLPGGALAELVRSPALVPAVVLAVGALVAVGLALALVPRDHSELLDRLAARPAGTIAFGSRAIALATSLLPGPSAALVRRDALVLVRGGFGRGALVLLALPLGVVAFSGAARDRSLEEWEARLAGLLLEAVLATIATFLFAVDFPRARAVKLVLEHAQPVRGRHVLLSRWFEASGAGVLVALGLGLVAARGTPRVAEAAAEIALSGSLLAIACAHYGAAFGLRIETTPGAELAFAPSVGMLAIAAALALAISPWAALAYPLFFFRAGRDAAMAWERAEAPRGAVSA